MLICDETLLRDQSPLSSHLPAPRQSPPNGASTVCVFLIFRYVERGRRWSRKKNKGIYLINLLECKRNEKGKTISNFSIFGYREANLVACQGGTWNQGLWVEFVRVVSARKIFRESYTVHTKQIIIVTRSPIYPLGVVCSRNLSQCVCETFLCILNVRYYILFFDISVTKESVAWRVRLRHWTCAGIVRSFYIRRLLS